MSNARKIKALRNLAERPGTEAEGQVAAEMLRKLEGKEEPKMSAIVQSELESLIDRMKAQMARDVMRQQEQFLFNFYSRNHKD